MRIAHYEILSGTVRDGVVCALGDRLPPSCFVCSRVAFEYVPVLVIFQFLPRQQQQSLLVFGVPCRRQVYRDACLLGSDSQEVALAGVDGISTMVRELRYYLVFWPAISRSTHPLPLLLPLLETNPSFQGISPSVARHLPCIMSSIIGL